MTVLITRVRRAIRRHGVVGASRAGALKLLPSSPEVERIKWYRLDLSHERPRRELGHGLELRRGTAADAAGVGQLPGGRQVSAPRSAFDVVKRLKNGGELWIVTDRDRVAFACWVFHREVRFHNAVATLPPATVQLEDSVLSPDFQGRSIPPAAWSGVADDLEARGVAVIMTKVDSANTEAVWAFRRAGFREVADMEVERRAYRHHMHIQFTTDDQSNRWLAGFEK
jgi:ribosomal protein S18 acetylase RimI-like enzyme